MPPRPCHDPSVRPALPLALAAAALLPGCVLLAPDRAVVLSTEPPGASVVVDGRDSGFVTPCELDLGTDETRRIDFELPGFRTESRILTPDNEVYSVLWREMNVGVQTWHFPLFLGLLDFFVPVKWTDTLAPGRIHVQLDRLADAKPLAGRPATRGASQPRP
jgi:hypothetical protein